MKEKTTISGHITALITILIWGMTFISTKILLVDFTPIEILFFRFVIGFLALLIVYPHRLKLTDKKQEWIFAFAGLTGVTLYYLLQNFALIHSLASNIGVVVSVAPFFTAILAHFFADKEALKPNFFIGFIAAIAGIILMSFSGGSGFEFHPLGDILAVLAAAVWAVYSLLAKKISTFGYNSIATTRHTFFYGLLFMIPVFFLTDSKLDLERFAESANLLNMLFLGLAASAICFVTWNYAVKLLGPVKTSVYIYIVPVVTVISSVLVLHEKITLVSALGIILALIGLFVSESKSFHINKREKQKQ
ncbi:MAG: EamA family transporter [Firmicutes bacterium HGW-Firmicutes-16]|nr:MAG: EamA family transporter [Firmicutes bacterium HGW-Firmicutes-16]